jgi:hypothetical protein
VRPFATTIKVAQPDQGDQQVTMLSACPSTFKIYDRELSSSQRVVRTAPRDFHMDERSTTRAPEYKEADRETAATGRPSLATVRARQGVTGHNGRYVLALGLAGVIVLLIVIYFIYIG